MTSSELHNYTTCNLQKLSEWTQDSKHFRLSGIKGFESYCAALSLNYKRTRNHTLSSNCKSAHSKKQATFYSQCYIDTPVPPQGI